MKVKFLLVLICFSFSFNFLFSAQRHRVICFDQKIEKVVASSLGMQSKFLLAHYKNVMQKNGVGRYFLNELKGMHIVLKDESVIQDLIDDLSAFCTDTKIAVDALVIAMTYFFRISDQVISKSTDPSEDLDERIIWNFFGCFMLACKYHEDVFVFNEDFICIFKMHTSFIPANQITEIKSYLNKLEINVLGLLGCDTNISSSIWEMVITRLQPHVFDKTLLEKIRQLSEAQFIDGYAEEIVRMVKAFGINCVGMADIRTFLINFRDNYPFKNETLDVLIQTIGIFDAVIKQGGLDKKDSVDDVLTMLFGSIMNADSHYETPWAKLFVYCMQQHSSFLGVHEIKGMVQLFSKDFSMNYKVFEDFIQKIMPLD